MAYKPPVPLQLTRCCHQLIATRFRCLRSLLLVNVSSDELIPVSLGGRLPLLALANTSLSVQLVTLQAIAAGDSSTVRVGQLKVDAKLVLRLFAALLPTASLSDIYGAFISYRHGLFAADAVEAMYLYLIRQVLGGKEVEVFRDSVKLKSGLSFDQSFLEAMLKALVVVPLITPDTLKRMMAKEGLNEVDHVLLEWWLALHLLAIHGFPVYRIAPILCGTVRHGLDSCQLPFFTALACRCKGRTAP